MLRNFEVTICIYVVFGPVSSTPVKIIPERDGFYLIPLGTSDQSDISLRHSARGDVVRYKREYRMIYSGVTQNVAANSRNLFHDQAMVMNTHNAIHATGKVGIMGRDKSRNAAIPGHIEKILEDHLGRLFVKIACRFIRK